MKCLKCGNESYFTAIGRITYPIRDDIDYRGNILHYGEVETEYQSTSYVEIECDICGETNIEGTNEVLKKLNEES